MQKVRQNQFSSLQNCLRLVGLQGPQFPETKNHVYQQRGEKMQNVPNKRFRNSLNDKFWLGTFFTINLFLQLLAINPSLQAFIALFSLSGKMIALQECRYRNEKRLAIISAKKRLLTICQGARSFQSLFPSYFFSFLVSLTCHFPSAGQGSLLSVLIIFIFTLDPYHINTLH